MWILKNFSSPLDPVKSVESAEKKETNQQSSRKNETSLAVRSPQLQGPLLQYQVNFLATGCDQNLHAQFIDPPTRSMVPLCSFIKETENVSKTNLPNCKEGCPPLPIHHQRDTKQCHHDHQLSRQKSQWYLLKNKSIKDYDNR